MIPPDLEEYAASLLCYIDKDRQEEVHLVLSVAREVVQESLGFHSFQLLFGHTVSLRPNESFKGCLIAR